MSDVSFSGFSNFDSDNAYGVKITANNYLSSIYIEHNYVSGFDQASIRQVDGTILTSQSASGNSTEFNYSISAGETVKITLSNGGVAVGTWNTAYTSANFPVQTTDFDVEYGVSGGPNWDGASSVYAIDYIQAPVVNPPDAPTNLAATAPDSSSIDLTWDHGSWNGDIGHFNIYRGTASGALSYIDQTTNQTYTDTGLSPATTYYYDVDAENSAGTSSDSNEASATTSLNSPTNVRFTDISTEDELTLDWDSVSGANGYYVYRAQASGSTTSDYTQVADVTSPPYTDTGLEDGEQYYYRVSSHD